MIWHKYRIPGRGSHSMRYIGEYPYTEWFQNHPSPNEKSLPIPTFRQWLRFLIGKYLLHDRWIIEDRCKRKLPQPTPKPSPRNKE